MKARRAPRNAPVVLAPWVGLSRLWVVLLIIGPTILAFVLGVVRDLAPKTGPGVAGQAWITDGDTLRIHNQRIRLQGIDAPENDQRCADSVGASWRCGSQATRVLTRKINGQNVSCRGAEHDRYGRLIAVCEVDGESLNAWMVRQGWAVAYTRYSYRYFADELLARTKRRGIWAGDFTMPEDWRRQRRK